MCFPLFVHRSAFHCANAVKRRTGNAEQETQNLDSSGPDSKLAYTAKGPFRPPRPSAEMRTRTPTASQLASMKLPP